MAGVTFTLEAAKRIAAAVRRVEHMPNRIGGNRAPSVPLTTTFWAALMGCDSTGLYWDWLAVEPAANTATVNNPWAFTAANMWNIREPYTAGWGNLREANGSRGIDFGTVVRVEFVGYIPAPSGSTNISGTAIDPSEGINSIDPSGAIPLYVFQHAGQTADPVMPIHDHRDNDPRNGGFAFSVYHPGTQLPQKAWGI